MYTIEYNRIEEDYSVLNPNKVLIGYIDPKLKMFISKAGHHTLDELEKIVGFIESLPESGKTD